MGSFGEYFISHGFSFLTSDFLLVIFSQSQSRLLLTEWRRGMIFWRGWGILVFIIAFASIFIGIGIMISSGTYEPDEAKATAYVYRLFALCLILSAACVFFLARYRDNTPSKVADPATGQIHLVPHVDEFMFIRMKYWPHILVAFSVFLFIRSFF